MALDTNRILLSEVTGIIHCALAPSLTDLQSCCTIFTFLIISNNKSIFIAHEPKIDDNNYNNTVFETECVFTW